MGLPGGCNSAPHALWPYETPGALEYRRQGDAMLPAMFMRIILTAALIFAAWRASVAAVTEANISTQAWPIVEAVGSAYRELNSLTLNGTITGTFDVAGETRREETSFQS